MVNFYKTGNIQSNEINTFVSIKDMKTKILNDNLDTAKQLKLYDNSISCRDIIEY